MSEAMEEPKTDAEIYVQGSCFCVYKELMSSKSNYLKRLFKESSRITISPPLNITAKTFDLVVDYCYNGSIVITPVNVIALRIAAELLEMSNVENGASTGDNLWQKTEDYFQRAIEVNKNYVVIILKSCLSQMPEAEIAANLMSRCIEALALAADEENNMVNYLHDIKTVHYKDFRLIAESLYKKLTGTAGQDLLYQIIDFYFKECTGNITDDEKMEVCNYIDCNILSPQLHTHAVLNPRLPLRFVFQALHKNYGTIISVANNDMKKTRCESSDAHTTLSALLQRDAALHQVAQLQSAMNATSCRVQSLEKELLVMRQIVQDNIEVKSSQSNFGKSWSCRQNLENKVERGQRGSISSSFTRTGKKVSDETQILGDDHNNTTKIEHKNFGRRLMNGLKNAFGVGTSNKKNSGGEKVHGDIKKIY